MKNTELFKKKINGSGSFLKGFSSIFNSLRVVSENKGLIKFFIIPFLLNLVLLAAIFYFSYTALKPWLSGFLAGDSWYINTLKYITGPLLVLLLLFITIIIYSITGNIISSPFNDLLSLKVEEKLTGVNFNENFAFSVFFGDMIRITGNVFRLIILILIINVFLLFLNIIPGAGQIIYSVSSFIITAFFLGFQFFDFPLERRRYIFKEKLLITLKFKSLTIGLGTGFFLISFIPLIGFSGLSLATIGGTKLFIDFIKPALIEKK